MTQKKNEIVCENQRNQRAKYNLPQMKQNKKQSPADSADDAEKINEIVCDNQLNQLVKKISRR